jgi:hypothetical protein
MPVVSRFKDHSGLKLLHWAIILERSLEKIEYIWDLFPDAINTTSFLLYVGNEHNSRKPEFKHFCDLKIANPQFTSTLDVNFGPTITVGSRCTPLCHMMAFDFKMDPQTARETMSKSLVL